MTIMGKLRTLAFPSMFHSMPSSRDNLDTFVSILKKVRVRTGDASHLQEGILAFTHVSFDLDDCVPLQTKDPLTMALIPEPE